MGQLNIIGIVDNIADTNVIYIVSYRIGVFNIFFWHMVIVSVMNEISVIFDNFAYFFYLLYLILSLITSIVHIPHTSENQTF